MLEQKVNDEFLKKYRENPKFYDKLTNEYVTILGLARIFDYISEMKKVKLVKNEKFDIILEQQLKDAIEDFKEKEKSYATMLCGN